MSDERAGLVVVGASLAGLRAAQAARRAGYGGPIELIGSERHLPYDRPPLSKAFLAPEGLPDFHATEEELQRDRIRLHLSVTALSLDGDTKTLDTDAGTFPWDSLIIATGAAPRGLPSIPAMEGVHTLRTLDDAVALRSSIQAGSDVLIVGAGFIGSEIASSARERGATVTIVEAAPVPLVRAVGATVGEAISALHGRNGVRLLMQTQITTVNGDGRVRSVVLNTGETVAADVVVVGVGASPATGWLTGSGVKLSPVDGGVICDQFLQTSLNGVYAAGDVCHWPNPLMDASMRLENWTNAADQGTRAGVNASNPAEAKPYETVPYFWSDWYGNRIQFVGTAVAEEVDFVSGSRDDDHFCALYRVGDRLVGAALLNERTKTMKLRRLIGQRGSWADALLIAASATDGSGTKATP